MLTANPGTPQSYSYANQVRDVADIYELVRVQSPRLISLIDTASYNAMSTKHEWPEDEIAPEQTTVTVNANGSIQTLTVASKAPFVLNAQVRVVETGEVLKVTAINDSSNVITVARGYGETTAAAIPSGHTLRIISKPKREATRASLVGDNHQPVLNYNFTEIFDGEATVSRTPTAVYGIGATGSQDPVGDRMNYFVSREIEKITRRMNSALIHGRRVQRSGSEPGTMGGLFYFMRNGNKVNAAGNLLTEKLLGDAFQKCFDAGATSVDTILTSAVQARNISRLFKAPLQVARQDNEGGFTIYRVVSELPIQGFRGEIVVDHEIPPGSLTIMPRSAIRIVPMRTMFDEPSRSPGDDFEARRVLGEYTAEFLNVDKVACEIHGLSANLIPDPVPEP